MKRSRHLEERAILEGLGLDDLHPILESLNRSDAGRTVDTDRLLARARQSQEHDEIFDSPRMPPYIYVVQEILKDQRIKANLLDRFIERVRNHISHLRARSQ